MESRAWDSDFTAHVTWVGFLTLGRLSSTSKTQGWCHPWPKGAGESDRWQDPAHPSVKQTDSPEEVPGKSSWAERGTVWHCFPMKWNLRRWKLYFAEDWPVFVRDLALLCSFSITKYLVLRHTDGIDTTGISQTGSVCGRPNRKRPKQASLRRVMTQTQSSFRGMAASSTELKPGL